MPLLPATVRFPEPGAFIRWFDTTTKVFQLARLMDYEYPLRYPYRLGNLTVGSKLTNPFSFKDLNPSKTKGHRYLAYLGLSPGALYEIWHPYDQKRLKWDKDPPDSVETDIVGKLTSEESPIDAPAYAVWIAPDLYPAVNALNVSDRTINPLVLWVAAKYAIREQAVFSAQDKVDLAGGKYETLPVNFGTSI